MHKFVSFNGKIIGRDQAFVPAGCSALFHGKSVFSTIAVHSGEPMFWQKHWARLNENAARLNIEFSSHSPAGVESLILQLLKANNVSVGRARVTLFEEGGIWPDDEPAGTSLVITTADLREIPKNFRITISPYRLNSRSPLAGVKSGNYLENVIAMNEARSRELDEAVMLNERGTIASGVMANIFWLKGGEMFTPSLSTGCLAGTTREFVLENIDCREAEVGIEDVRSAEAVFLTSAGVGVIQAAKFDARQFDRIDHPIMRLWPW